jgi:hypothetical protein
VTPNCGRALAAPLPLAGEVGAERRVRALSSWGFSIVEAPSPIADAPRIGVVYKNGG